MYISANDARRINIGVSVFHPHNPSYTFYGDSKEIVFKLWQESNQGPSTCLTTSPWQQHSKNPCQDLTAYF